MEVLRVFAGSWQLVWITIGLGGGFFIFITVNRSLSFYNRAEERKYNIDLEATRLKQITNARDTD